MEFHGCVCAPLELHSYKPRCSLPHQLKCEGLSDAAGRLIYLEISLSEVTSFTILYNIGLYQLRVFTARSWNRSSNIAWCSDRPATSGHSSQLKWCYGERQGLSECHSRVWITRKLFCSLTSNRDHKLLIIESWIEIGPLVFELWPKKRVNELSDKYLEI